MLRDFPAHALHYDASADVARVEVGESGGPTRTVRALLLLDANGFLVGIDLGGEALARVVVLLGSYEKVDRTVEAEVEVAYGTGAEPGEVRIRGARKAIRAAEANPYARKSPGD